MPDRLAWLRIAMVVWFAVGALVWVAANLPPDDGMVCLGGRASCYRAQSIADWSSMATTALPWLTGTLALRLLATRMARRRNPAGGHIARK